MALLKRAEKEKQTNKEQIILSNKSATSPIKRKGEGKRAEVIDEASIELIDQAHLRPPTVRRLDLGPPVMKNYLYFFLFNFFKLKIAFFFLLIEFFEKNDLEKSTEGMVLATAPQNNTMTT